MSKPDTIQKTPAEITSTFDRQRWAELLILQLPNTHDGRNSWLLNFGVLDEAEKLRKDYHKKLVWDEKHQAALLVEGT